MECGNTQAEIDRDTQTDAQEQAQYVAESVLWKMCLNQLLQGKTVEMSGRSANLAERMADQHQEFANFVDCDFDFMHYYKVGELEKSLCKLIEAEARTLASIIVG